MFYVLCITGDVKRESRRQGVKALRREGVKAVKKVMRFCGSASQY